MKKIISGGVEMHDIGMMYEIGKLRMQEFIGDAERRRETRDRSTMDRIFIRGIAQDLTSRQYACTCTENV